MAYDFVAASSQYLTTATSPLTNRPGTITAIFNAANTTSGGALVSANAVTTGARTGIFAAGNISGDPVRASLISATTGADADTTTGYSANVQTNAVGTITGSTATAYINGGSSASSTDPAPGTYTNFTQLGIGARHNGTSWGVFYDGSLAEAAIWNVVLTDAEIASLGKGFKASRIRPQSLVFYAPLIRDLQDVKGALAITNNNTATVAVHPRVI